MDDRELTAGLQELISEVDDILEIHRSDAAHDIFDDKAKHFVRRHIGDRDAVRLHNILVGPTLVYASGSELSQARKQTLYNAQKLLKVLVARVERGDHRIASPATQTDVATQPPRVFIAHSGEPSSLTRLVRFMEALEVKPIIAEWLPFKCRQVPDHARHAMDGCAAAIVFATAADGVGERGQPGRGVLTETGILQERFDDKVIYLLEEGASFGAMADGFAHESFTQDNLEGAFLRIVLELKAHAII